MRTIGYARLRTAEQAEGQALEQQIDRLMKAGASTWATAASGRLTPFSMDW